MRGVLLPQPEARLLTLEELFKLLGGGGGLVFLLLLIANRGSLHQRAVLHGDGLRQLLVAGLVALLSQLVLCGRELLRLLPGIEFCQLMLLEDLRVLRSLLGFLSCGVPRLAALEELLSCCQLDHKPRELVVMPCALLPRSLTLSDLRLCVLRRVSRRVPR